MKSTNDKCHLLVLNQKDNTIRIGTEEVTGSTSVKLLGVTIDNKLNFEEHVTKLCKKANLWNLNSTIVHWCGCSTAGH